MSGELTSSPAVSGSTMDRLERLKRLTEEGVEYWLAREINVTLGYPNWREFEALLERAGSISPGKTTSTHPHHFVALLTN